MYLNNYEKKFHLNGPYDIGNRWIWNYPRRSSDESNICHKIKFLRLYLKYFDKIKMLCRPTMPIFIFQSWNLKHTYIFFCLRWFWKKKYIKRETSMLSCQKWMLLQYECVKNQCQHTIERCETSLGCGQLPPDTCNIVCLLKDVMLVETSLSVTHLFPTYQCIWKHNVWNCSVIQINFKKTHFSDNPRWSLIQTCMLLWS